MFQFPALAPKMIRWRVFNTPGCPIRKSPDQRLFAPPRSLSQLITSFIASESQGIRHAPFFTFLIHSPTLACQRDDIYFQLFTTKITVCLYNMSCKVTAVEVKNAFQGVATAQTTVIALFEEMMRDFKARTGIDRAESTYKQYEVLHDQLKDFLKIQYHASDIPFTELDLPFIESLDFYFRVRRKMKARTVKSRLVLFNKVVLLALHRNIISRHPFAGFETEKITAQDKSLTPEELERLLSTPLKSATQRFIRDMFVFSVFTGISYADLKKLAWKDIIRENDGSLWISADRQKTKTAFNVKLLDIPVQIMDYYEGLAEGDSVFPAMSLGQVNVGLKRIARHCKINRALTYHMGRYTFASQICLSQGVPIESVSRMLGHTNIQTTQRYARLNNGKIISDMKMFAERVANEFNFIP